MYTVLRFESTIRREVAIQGGDPFVSEDTLEDIALQAIAAVFDEDGRINLKDEHGNTYLCSVDKLEGSNWCLA